MLTGHPNILCHLCISVCGISSLTVYGLQGRQANGRPSKRNPAEDSDWKDLQASHFTLSSLGQ